MRRGAIVKSYLQVAQTGPSRDIDLGTSRAMRPERFDLDGVRFARHDHHLGAGEQGLRQPRPAVRDNRVPIAPVGEELRCVGVVQ